LRERKEASARRREANRARAERRTHKRVRARPIYPGARVKITRRCNTRRLFLNPHGNPKRGHTAEENANFYGYTTARAVRKYGMLFHGANAMGNHHHQDTTDVRGVRPNYKNSVHSNLARGLNCHLGRFDSFWSHDRSCDTTTRSDDETFEDLAYTDCNPVDAGLVKWGHLWPGFTTYGWRFGETRVFTRPDWYYHPDNPDNPPEIALTRVRPPGIFPELTDDELSDKLMARCREIELDKQKQMKQDNRRFMGLKKLAKQKWWEEARSWEDRYTLVPKFASSDKWKRIAAIQEDRHWQAQYAQAREELIEGIDAEFPYGTWLLHQHYNVRIAAPP
jgi:hypothetical protein